MQTNGGIDGIYLQAFADYQRHRNFSPKTVGCRQAVLTAFAAHIQPRSLLAASPEDVEGWLRTRRLGAQGRYTYISHLHSFYRFAGRRGLATTDPTDAIDRPKLPRRLPRPITPAELEKALEAAGPEMRAWLYLGAYQGLRRAEIAALAVEDVMGDQGLLRVNAGKGAKDGMLPLHPAVLAAVKACATSRSGPLFRLESGAAVTPDHVGDAVGSFLRRLGIDRTTHSLRHHFGTQAYRLCRDLMLTSSLMRHASVTSTEPYVDFDPTPGAAVVSLIGGDRSPRDRVADRAITPH